MTIGRNLDVRVPTSGRSGRSTGPEAGMPAVAAARLLLVPAVAFAGALITVRWWRQAHVV